MSDASRKSDLDDCNCCAAPEDPPLDNRPRLPTLKWRVGTFATFLDKMKAALPGQTIPDGPHASTRPLRALTTRDSDDAAMALLDAAAITCDILSFYNERILNEGYLRTATERRSVLEMARTIGYELSPGVAASTYLAFTLEEPLAQSPMPIPATAEIAVGTRVQSVPGQGQLPQIFETVEAITAQRAWNAMKPLALRRQNLQVKNGALQALAPPNGTAYNAPSLWLAGTATNLKVGDLLLVRIAAENRKIDDEISQAASLGAVVVTVAGVITDFSAGRTRIDLAVPPPQAALPPFSVAPVAAVGRVETASLPLNLDKVRTKILEQTWDEGELAAFLAVQKWNPDEVLQFVAAALSADPAPAEVFAFRAKSGVFGAAAPPYKQFKGLEHNPWGKAWDKDPDDATSTDASCWKYSDQASYYATVQNADLFLEQTAQGVARGGFVILDHPTQEKRFYLINRTTESALADFAISGKSTGLRLSKSTTNPDAELLGNNTQDKAPGYTMRGTTVHFQSQPLPVASVPIDDVLAEIVTQEGKPVLKGASSLLLDRMVLGLAVGKRLAISGTIAVSDGSSSGVAASEVATLLKVSHARGYTTLVFETALSHPYVRSTVVVNGNLATASHGETVTAELLGSGDGTVANQKFGLRRAPLTYVSAPTPSGVKSTLTVRVNNLAWEEVPSLYGLGPDSRAYTLRATDDGKTTITFGDGKSGGRLPTGQNNLSASYRIGLGPDGEVAAGALCLLQSRPLGLKSVTNPVPATGAAPPETLASARTNAPLKVRTLDRVVSIDDYEDFVRAFAGIGKAQAALLWSGERHVVHLTVASATGGQIPDDAKLHDSLIEAILAASDGLQQVVVQSYRPRFFKLDATLTIAPARELSAVLAAATTALKSAFAFPVRAFGQAVTQSEVIGVLQTVPGVIAVDLDYLHDTDEAQVLRSVIPAAGPTFSASSSGTVAAELLLLAPAGIVLQGVRP